MERRVLGGMQILLMLALSACDGSPAKPTTQQMQQPVGDYLVDYKKASCDGDVRLQGVDVKRIGKFDKVLGGFPVFADFSVTCDARPGGIVTISSTFEAKDGATTGAAVCYARPSGGAYSCVMPDVLRSAEKQIQQQMNEAMRNVGK